MILSIVITSPVKTWLLVHIRHCMKPSVLAHVLKAVVYWFYGRVLDLERSKLFNGRVLDLESRARPGALEMNRACELGRSETADPCSNDTLPRS